jgi:hypothetical protein
MGGSSERIERTRQECDPRRILAPNRLPSGHQQTQPLHKKKNGKKKAQEELIEVEEEETWKVKTPVKSSDEQEKRLATIEKAHAEQPTLVTTLTNALGKTRVDCNKVLIKANIAIEDSSRAVNALVKHLVALDEEIGAYVKIVANSESAQRDI